MYSELLFDKPLAKVVYEDLCAYFSSAKPESQTLEFKSYVVIGVKEKDRDKDLRERENDVLKTICGFLNCEGGLIIWGAPKGEEVVVESGKDKIFYGDLTPVPANIPKDQFIARIVNSISPTPSGVLYHQVVCSSGGFIYLFEVSKSLFPPHQFQHIYWMRLDGHTRAAPHYYVEALMKQIKHVDIRGFVRNGQSMKAREHGLVPFVFSVHNFSRHITAINVHYSLLIDYGIVHYEDDEETNIFNEQYDGRIDRDLSIGKDLHYDLPFQRAFYVAFPEWGDVKTFGICLFVYASNCPVKVSMYTYEIYTAGDSPIPQIRMTQKDENLLSFSGADLLGKTDDERAIDMDNIIIKQMREAWGDGVRKYKKPDL